MRTWLLVAALAVAGMGCSDSESPPGGGALDDAGPDDGNGGSGKDGGGSARIDAGRDSGTARDAAGSDACDALDCQAPATCDASENPAVCTCPDGYTLASDDVSCDDVDECAQGSDDCDAHATCANTEGGFTCTCDAPAYQASGDPSDGTACECADGYSVDGDACLADDGTGCDDDAACASGHCVSGVCCASACDTPSQCELADGATCVGGSTCAYTMNADDGTACDDGDACTDDACAAGTCVGTAKVCDDGKVCTQDSCDSATGCVFNAAIKNGDVCDDADPCTVSDQCDAGFCLGEAKDCDDGDDCTADDCNPSDGLCLHDTAAANGNTCEDGDLCTFDDFCMDGTCQRGQDKTCNDGLRCTNDSCNVDTGECEAVNNRLTCNDQDPCTINDRCMGGLCSDVDPKDCSGQDDQCNSGVCEAGTGNCVKQPLADGLGCDDGDPCTAVDQCDTGTCVGAGKACGSQSSACQDCADNPSHAACQAGDDRICTCSAGWIQDVPNGVCVPDTNECNNDPCGPNTNCVDNDPALNAGVVCTCKAGFEGADPAGAGCTDIDDCAGNPCGAGTCVEGAPGQGYSCNCNAGRTEVLGTCRCDLNGVFAIEITTDVQWSGITGVENGSETVRSWALRQHVYDDQGELTVTTIPCGGTAPDICGSTFQEAHNQYLPDSIWGLPTMPTELLTMNVPNASQGQGFTTPETAALFGISLTNPMGAWPAGRCNVRPLVTGDGCSTSTPQTNGATWVNHDDDLVAAVTSYAYPPGTLTATVCPRLSGGTWPWAYWPGLEGFTVRRVKRFATGTRARSYLDGTIGACSPQGVQTITGKVKGYGANGQMRNDARVRSCVRVTTGSGETACSSTLVNFYDGQSQAQQITDSDFVIDRLDSATSCSDVWAHFNRTDYPPILP